MAKSKVSGAGKYILAKAGVGEENFLNNNPYYLRTCPHMKINIKKVKLE